MANLQLKRVPITKTGMLIRKPVAEMFEAFVVFFGRQIESCGGSLSQGDRRTLTRWSWENLYAISAF